MHLANLYEDPDGFDDYELFKKERWKFFVGGTEDEDVVTIFQNCLAEKGLDVGSNRYFIILYLNSGKVAIIMDRNNLKIHMQTGEIIHSNTEVGENIYQFLKHQLNETKRTIETILHYLGNFVGFRDYLSTTIDTEEQ